MRILESWDIHQWAQWIGIWDDWRSWSSKTEDLLSMKLLIWWEFHWVQFRAFWKTVWKCFRLLPNSCLAFWVRNRRRILLTCVRTFKKTFQEMNSQYHHGSRKIAGDIYWASHTYFIKCFEWWHDCWDCCIKSQEGYLKGTTLISR